MTEYFQELRERLELPSYDPYKNIKKFLKFLAILIILAVLVLVGYRLFELAQYRFSMKADIVATFMNTRVEIKAYGVGASAAAEEAINEMERAARKLDALDPRSEISLINSMAGIASVSVSKSTLDIIVKSIKLSDLTNGAFKISDGKIEVDPEVGNVMLPVRGMKLYLDEISKGFVISIGRHTLLSKGIKSALISAGSSVSCIGAMPDGKLWNVAIRSPENTSKLLGIVSLAPGQSLSTSGDLHILDLFTGHPASSCEAVTIISDDSTVSDALSDAVFIMGPKKGLRFLNKLGTAQGLIIDSNGNIITTTGFKLEKAESI